MAQIVGYNTEPCLQCGGAGFYYFDGPAAVVTAAPQHEDAECIDPCDHCNGTGEQAVPIYSDDPSEPTPEDLRGYPV